MQVRIQFYEGDFMEIPALRDRIANLSLDCFGTLKWAEDINGSNPYLKVQAVFRSPDLDDGEIADFLKDLAKLWKDF